MLKAFDILVIFILDQNHRIDDGMNYASLASKLINYSTAYHCKVAILLDKLFGIEAIKSTDSQIVVLYWKYRLMMRRK